MRHRIYGKHLGKTAGQRQAFFKTLVQSLFLYGTIQTSEIKAKAVKGLVDQIITSAKSKSTQGKVQSYIPDKDLQERLIKEILPNLKGRTSGYTRVIKTGPRLGDNTTMVEMSLIGAEELKPFKKEPKSHKELRESEGKRPAPVKKLSRTSKIKTSPRKKK